MKTSQKLTTKEAAKLYNLTPHTLERWRSQSRGPKYAKLGKRILYDVSDLEAFFTAHYVDTADSPAADKMLRGKNER